MTTTTDDVKLAYVLRELYMMHADRQIDGAQRTELEEWAYRRIGDQK